MNSLLGIELPCDKHLITSLDPKRWLVKAHFAYEENEGRNNPGTQSKHLGCPIKLHNLYP